MKRNKLTIIPAGVELKMFPILDYEIYLDIDGVIADFFRAVCRLYNIDPIRAYSEYSPVGEWNLGRVNAFADKVLSNYDIIYRIDTAGKQFWECDIKPYQFSIEYWKRIMSKYKVIFITSPMDVNGYYQGRLNFLRRHFGNKSITNLEITIDKSRHVRPNRILIDDKTENVHEWRKAGGPAILYPRPWNEANWRIEPKQRADYTQEYFIPNLEIDEIVNQTETENLNICASNAIKEINNQLSIVETYITAIDKDILEDQKHF